MHRLIEEREADVPGQPRPKVATFDEVAADWLHQLQHVDAIKPSTLSDYRYMLRTPHAEPRKRGRRRAAGRVLAEFGGRAIDTLTTAQVERWLERLDAQDISKRTVNKHRQVVCSVLEHAVRPLTATASRPTSPAPRRSVANRSPACSTSTSPRRSPHWRGRRARARIVIPADPPSRPPSEPNDGSPTVRTQRCSWSRLSLVSGWASCWSCVGEGSASSAQRSPSRHRGQADR
jgi:hypothetical protein